MKREEYLKAVDDYLTKDVRKEQKKLKKHTVYKPPSWKKDNPGKYQVLEGPEPDEDQGPSSSDYKKEYKYRDPKTGEIYIFNRRGAHKKNGRILVPVCD